MLIALLGLVMLAVNLFGAYAAGGWPAAFAVIGGWAAGWLACVGVAKMVRDQ